MDTIIIKGNTETLSVTAVTPINARDRSYTWKSSNTSIATVSAEGLVTAKAVGTVTISAEANDHSGVKAECEVSIYNLLSSATSSDIGKVVCNNGHLHNAKTAVAAPCTAVGILGKVSSTGHGLILALQNASQATANGVNGWSNKSVASTTIKLLPAANYGSLTSYTELGTITVSNWGVASQADYTTIFKNLGSTSGYNANVNAYITTGVGGTALSGNYLSSTRKNVSGAGSMGVYFSSGGWETVILTARLNIRPVLGF